MTDALFSPLWHRVAELRPRIAPSARIHVHHYRGKPSFVVEERTSGQHQRLSLAGWRIAALLDGRRTLDEIWTAVSEAMGDEAPGQTDTIRLIGELHGAGLLLTDAPPDVEALLRRYRKTGRTRRRRRWSNPLAVEKRLFDPDPMLRRLDPLGRALFSRAGAVLWAALVLGGLLIAFSHWDALAAHARTRALDPTNVLLILLIYPLVKLFHELGHGLAVRRWGGTVPSCGVLLLVGLPMPYVDASAASVFPEKHRRIIVSAAGIGMEVVLAAVALLAWLYLEPGLLRDAAFDVALIGGVSTVVFNANPLLKFDGYYIMQDWLEIPNFASRSRRHLLYLARRHLFGVVEAEPEAIDTGEALWMTGYALAAALYRLLLMVTLSLMLANEYALAGAALAVWALTSYAVLPAVRGLRYLFVGHELGPRRARAMAVTAILAAATITVVGVVPMPRTTAAQGVVWVPPGTELRARADGFLRDVLITDGDSAQPGQLLMRTTDPLLPARVAALEAELAGLKLSRRSAWGKSAAEASMIDESIAALTAQIDDARDQVARLELHSPGAGRVLVLPDALLLGRFVRRGELLGYVHGSEPPTVRVVIPQTAVDLVARHTDSVEILSTQHPGETLTARIVSRVPAPSAKLPSPVLGTLGGGDAAIDPLDEEGLRGKRTHYQFELAPDGTRPLTLLGSRVQVRFRHGEATVAVQSWRRLRQMFLRGLGV